MPRRIRAGWASGSPGKPARRRPDGRPASGYPLAAGPLGAGVMGSARLWRSPLRRPEISCRRLCRISLIEACNTRSRSGKPSPFFFLDGGFSYSESGIAIVVLSTNRAQTHPRGQVQIPRALTCCGIRSDKQRGIVILLNLTWPRFENESAKPHYSSLRNPGKFGLGNLVASTGQIRLLRRRSHARRYGTRGPFKGFRSWTVA